MATPMLTQNDNGANNVLEGLVKKRSKTIQAEKCHFPIFEQKSIIASNTVGNLSSDNFYYGKYLNLQNEIDGHFPIKSSH